MPTLVSKAPTGPEWVHEVKWDGYRLSAYLEDGKVTIRTRRGHDWTDRFPAIAAAMAALPVHSAVIDGEAVVLDAEGRSDFGALQAALGIKGRLAADVAVFYAFDLLFLDGHDLRPWKLEGRRDALEAVLDPTSRTIMLSVEIEGDGPTIFRHACNHGLEGIVSKRRDKPYTSGRVKEWLKTKCIQSDTFFVIGYEKTAGALASIRLAHFESGTLISAGGVGTGFTRSSAADLERRLKKFITDKPPVFGMRDRGVIWTKPKIRVEVEYRGWTADGNLRHPSFKGVRED
ncbi:non-homologous end-joining DNA ligase [Microvirga brassicacearum]|uniref:non-homologous end-joining DNA ligase n=1 Tax=Microvirga brassicacearum TaxID=2580413 RepID=UPI001FCE3D5D|nr:non-homologous end-joining DNA ligase [Microvirga brassicacearum]